MNFILRTHHKGGGPFRNEGLGPWYTITPKGSPNFEGLFELMFEKGKGPTSSENYFCLISCERGVIPIFDDNDAYIMSESGATFEKIYTHPLSPVSGYKKANPEQELVMGVQVMCEESLDPEKFEKWEEVKDALYRTRTALKVSGES